MPNRRITHHKLNGLNDHIEIYAMDDASEGGACHEYEIRVQTKDRLEITKVKFQNGPVGSATEVNGLSNEALQAIVIDRLQCFQGMLTATTGKPAPYACRENALALTKQEESSMWLQKRTRDRLARGVEGQNKP